MSAFLRVLSFVAFLGVLVSWFAMGVYMVAASKHRRPEVSVRHQLRWNPFNALWSERWLTETGIVYRRRFFLAALAFISSLAAAFLVHGSGSLLE
jgi:hypothetical protein